MSNGPIEAGLFAARHVINFIYNAEAAFVSNKDKGRILQILTWDATSETLRNRLKPVNTLDRSVEVTIAKREAVNSHEK